MSRPTGHILVAEGDSALAGILQQRLVAAGHRVTHAANGRQALRALAADSFDVALLDTVMPAPDGFEVLRALADDPDPPAVIIAAAQGTVDTAVLAMKRGAFGYLAKPYRITELDAVITRALEYRALAHQNATLRGRVARLDGDTDFLTEYAPLRAVVATALSMAAGDDPILIVGAPGTGKCTLARAIHARSRVVHRPFMQLEERALADEHVARTLFGRERGDKGPGMRAALATCGSLFLHDVHALRRSVQTRLADALSRRLFRIAARREERPVRARVIAAATSWLDSPSATPARDLAAVFRARCITLPPLRERAVDIPILATAFLEASGAADRVRFDPPALDAMREYAWPGNVAELRAVVERARLLSRDGIIRVTDLALAPDGNGLELSEVERRHILAVLRANNWHQAKSAENLGISPKTLYRKIREYSLLRPSPEIRGESSRHRR